MDMQTRSGQKLDFSEKLNLHKARAWAVDHVRESPIRSVGIAAGAGFVLGGGLASATTLRVLRKSVAVTLQMTVLPILVMRLRDLLMDATESTL